MKKNRFRLDQRGDTLTTLIMFPVVLIMLFLVLQVWFWSSARTTAQTVATEGLEAAQNLARTTVEGVDVSDSNIATAGVNRAIDRFTDVDTFFKSSRSGYSNCPASDETKPAVASIVEQGEDCQPEQGGKPLVELKVGDDQITSKVTADVYTLLIPFTGQSVSVSTCGPKNLRSWAPNRLSNDLSNDLEDMPSDTWGDAWNCEP